MRRFQPAITLLLVAVLPLSAGLWTCSAQEQDDSPKSSELDRVRKISELTGRPIFAVAGRST